MPHKTKKKTRTNTNKKKARRVREKRKTKKMKGGDDDAITIPERVDGSDGNIRPDCVQ
jgi:hypothetical protein